MQRGGHAENVRHKQLVSDQEEVVDDGGNEDAGISVAPLRKERFDGLKVGTNCLALPQDQDRNRCRVFSCGLSKSLRNVVKPLPLVLLLFADLESGLSAQRGWVAQLRANLRQVLNTLERDTCTGSNTARTEPDVARRLLPDHPT